MNQTITQKGLSGFSLKYLAMALMVLDHIQYFFAYTGKIPVFFSMLGRLAAPLFLFCVIEGFTHTHDRKKYFLRIYLLSVLMGAIQFSFYNIGNALVRPDGFFPQNQMLASFAILIVMLQGFEWCSGKKWGRGLASILIPVLLPFAISAMMMASPNPALNFSLNLLAFTLPLFYHGRRNRHPDFRSHSLPVPEKQEGAGFCLCGNLCALGYCAAPFHGSKSWRCGLLHSGL